MNVVLAAAFLVVATACELDPIAGGPPQCTLVECADIVDCANAPCDNPDGSCTCFRAAREPVPCKKTLDAGVDAR